MNTVVNELRVPEHNTTYPVKLTGEELNFLVKLESDKFLQKVEENFYHLQQDEQTTEYDGQVINSFSMTKEYEICQQVINSFQRLLPLQVSKHTTKVGLIDLLQKPQTEQHLVDFITSLVTIESEEQRKTKIILYFLSNLFWGATWQGKEGTQVLSKQ